MLAAPQMRQTLLSWVRGAGAADPTNIPPFVRNKIAQLVVFVIQACAATAAAVPAAHRTPLLQTCAEFEKPEMLLLKSAEAVSEEGLRLPDRVSLFCLL